MTFQQLGLSAPILSALDEQGYESPSPIQEKAIPPALEGRDVLGCAQTGTGKTCAFATPILQRLTETPGPRGAIRALILTPTRELAIQIGESFEGYGKHLRLRHCVIFGGVSQNPQVAALKKGCEILVATPGRLMDLHNQGFISLEHLEIFVLDEADRMLDMGFIHDVKKILKWLPEQKQTLFFSATMPPEITHLVNSLLHDPVRVTVDPVSSPVEAIAQTLYMVDRNNKTRLLAHLVKTLAVRNALVFTRTKHGANKVARDLGKAGITAAAIHGNKGQTARQQALADFKAGKLRCLVATDIAARGLDIEELSHVFNYNLPEVPETYVHRIGRTGRAGREGEAIAFCDFSEKPLLKDVERLMGKKIPLVEDHPFPMEVFEAPKRDKHGKLINEEDAEAREAARALKKVREEAKSAAQAAKKATEVVLEKVGELTEPKPKRKKSSGKGKVSQQVEQAQRLAQSPVEELPEEPVDDFDPADHYAPAKPKLVRPGTFMDTGDSMPCTEFERPNPLDSDVIMDATARLLSRRTASGLPSTRRKKGGQSQEAQQHQPRREGDDSRQEGRRPQSRRRRGGGRPQSETREGRPVRKAADQPLRKEEARKQDRPARKAESRKQDQSRKKQGGQAPRQEKRSAPRKNRSGDRRPEPVRNHPKDSTEQPSLMKPYYIDFGK